MKKYNSEFNAIARGWNESFKHAYLYDNLIGTSICLIHKNSYFNTINYIYMDHI